MTQFLSMVKLTCPICTETINITKPKKGMELECPVCGVNLKVNRVGGKLILTPASAVIDEGEPVEGLEDDTDSDI